jgi:sugar lactone lactonase YvrE
MLAHISLPLALTLVPAVHSVSNHTTATLEPYNPPNISKPSAPVAQRCGPDTAYIVCINRYGSLLPQDFARDPSPFTSYSNTTVPSDPSWAQVKDADFILFDRQRGLELLGRRPSLERMFDVPFVIHEAPVYVPAQNKLYVSQYGPPGNVDQIVIDLNKEPPTLRKYQTDPVTYTPNGAVLNGGMIYWAVAGNNISLPQGAKQRPGIARTDPRTGETEMLLDNYYGFFFSGPNDLTFDDAGDIWFTDSDYSYIVKTSAEAPQMQLATWRFRPSTGEIKIVEDTLNHPNGIAFSPDGKTLYLGDSGLEHYSSTPTRGPNDFYAYPIEIEFNSTLKRNVYAYDVVRLNPDQPFLTNRRVIWQSLEGAPDGLKVARNGYLLVAGGLVPGVDILDASGSQIARIQTSHAVENMQWTGHDFKTLWLTGIGGISRVRFALEGPEVV